MAVITVLLILVVAILAYIPLGILKHRRRLLTSNCPPGTIQPLTESNLLVMLGFFPRSLLTWYTQAGFALKWANMYKLVNSDIVYSVSPSRLAFYTASPQHVIQITHSLKEYFPKPTFFYAVLRIFGENLVTSEGEVWRRHRKVVSFGFSERNNRQVFTETEKFARGMCNELEKIYLNAPKNTSPSVDVVRYALKLALCVISTAAFGFEAEWETERKAEPGFEMSFFEALEQVSSHPVEVIAVPRWMLHLPIRDWRRVGVALKDFKKYLNLAIERGKSNILQEMTESVGKKDDVKEEKRRADTFSALVRGAFAEKEGKELALNDDELMGNVYVLLVAGHETSAHTLGFALGLLALYPNVQERFYQEIMSVTGDKDSLTYEDMNALKYGMAIMNETLRMYPIVTIIPKWAPEDVWLSEKTETSSENEATTTDTFIPGGSIVNLHVTGVHYNEKYWGPDASEFKPERFIEREWKREWLLAFSDGPRACIGKRFAQIEVVTALALLVKRFEIRVNDEQKGVGMDELLESHIQLTLIPKNPVRLVFVPRSNKKTD